MTDIAISRRTLAALGVAAAFGARPSSASAEVGRDVFFVRHAESEVNIAFDAARPDSGVSYPLTATGVAQAAAMAARFADARPAALYASVQLRAVQTADAISFRTGAPVRLAAELVEIEFGAVDRGSTQAQALAAIRAIYMGWLAGNTDLRAPGGESFEAVRARVLAAVDRGLRTATAGGPVIFVSHRATLMTMGPQLFTNVTPAFAAAHPLPNCGVIHGRLSAGRLSCLAWDGAVPS